MLIYEYIITNTTTTSRNCLFSGPQTNFSVNKMLDFIIIIVEYDE